MSEENNLEGYSFSDDGLSIESPDGTDRILELKTSSFAFYVSEDDREDIICIKLDDAGEPLSCFASNYHVAQNVFWGELAETAKGTEPCVYMSDHLSKYRSELLSELGIDDDVLSSKGTSLTQGAEALSQELRERYDKKPSSEEKPRLGEVAQGARDASHDLAGEVKDSFNVNQER